MSKKLRNMLDSIYGKTVKGRWWKIPLSIGILFAFLTISVSIVTNMGYDSEKGFYWKPWDVSVKYNRTSGGSE